MGEGVLSENLRVMPLAPTLPASDIFFFQAEDGIRDFHVTGVQTCALPICQCERQSCDQSDTPHRGEAETHTDSYVRMRSCSGPRRGPQKWCRPAGPRRPGLAY